MNGKRLDKRKRVRSRGRVWEWRKVNGKVKGQRQGGKEKKKGKGE